MKKTANGFTLIEVMIVVVIIAILATIAYPAYQDSMRKARRADAKAALLEDAQWLERNYTESNRYDQKPGGGAVSKTDLPFQTAPRDSATVFYQISFQAGPAAQSYTLQAVPQGDQANDGCGTLTLNQAGVRGQTSGSTSDCWAR
ncbi:type IV pilin protein [Thiohalobacter sp. IOR34]|uniref:type IV pilin protein n=1 Tax=Thiohalobacter sp. IOR34 TaxID=3057176 RepID=UPI0025AF0187|nr:type IV pilin protein [Thiohalobacter sp. IOR34]WJW75095.1 type IV pilin protein [Thiohalobacter sp. IOR34]